jgi:hypothetical protein
MKLVVAIEVYPPASDPSLYAVTLVSRGDGGFWDHTEEGLQTVMLLKDCVYSPLYVADI